MSTVRKWSGVAVAMQSALGAAKTITGITLAAPGVVSAVHDFVNGDYVVLNVQGMYQINGRVFRVVNVVGTATFDLEDVSSGVGIDTSAFNAFESGTVEKITFGSSITSATSMSASGGDFDFIDTTTIHNNVKSQIPGAANPINYTFDNLWDITDSGQIAMKAASDIQGQRAFKFTFGQGGPIMVFTGYVGYTGAPGGSAQDKIISPATITAFGLPSYYSA